ncbi:hypothetical protein M9Y10_026105 [Tritrichomonas musculus]|uniref:Uncharacterized protein n=1 Tax=Tritrichomonas musculus TaxID=1915356 RepID=A0ABR2H8G0_9EUKA
MGDSGKNLADKTSGANWFQGQRFASNANNNDVKKWMDKIIKTNTDNEIKFVDKTISKGLPLVAIIGIVVAAVVVVVAIIVVVIIVVKRKRNSKSNDEASN